MQRRLLLVWLMLAASASGQRLYNAGQDRRAQEALQAGKAITPGAGFDAALANLDQIWTMTQNQVFQQAHTQMRADMGTWTTWGALKESAKAIEARLQPQLAPADPAALKAQLAAAKEARKAAAAELADFAKTVSGSPAAGIASAGTWLERLSQVEPLARYLIGLEEDQSGTQAQLDAAGKATDALKSLAALYKGFRLDLPKNPHALLLEYQLQALTLAVSHVNEEMQIQQRLDRELTLTTEVLGPVQTALRTLDLPDDERIGARLDGVAARRTEALARREWSAAGNDQKEMRELVFLLYNASALAARGNTAVRLADLRTSMEERANSLRLAGGAAALHQQLVVSGLQRLALYYQGGVKGSSIADLIQSLATAGIAPAVWTK